MENYLKKGFILIEESWLDSESKFEEFFTSDYAELYVDQDQNHPTPKLEFLVKIGNRFFEVCMRLEWNLRKHYSGDMRYFFDGIEDLDWKEIHELPQKPKREWNWKMELDDDQFVRLIQFLKDNKIENSFS